MGARCPNWSRSLWHSKPAHEQVQWRPQLEQELGTVSLPMNRSNGGLFAVKSTVSSIPSSQNEYDNLRSLDSLFIIRCLGRDQTVENGMGMDNLFMEYMPGGSIVDLLDKFGRQLDESVIRAYKRGILGGIHYLHRQGIVHCDIKGKNVLVGANGVKLGDFGFAKRIVDEGGNMDVDERYKVRGTPLWMAPEVLNVCYKGLLRIFGLWVALWWRWPLAGLPSEMSLIRLLLCIGLPAQRSCLSFRCHFRHKGRIFWTSASGET